MHDVCGAVSGGAGERPYRPGLTHYMVHKKYPPFSWRVLVPLERRFAGVFTPPDMRGIFDAFIPTRR